MLPVSSSGHLVLLPELLRWPYTELEPEVRKSFEVALHSGTAAALAIGFRAELRDFVRAPGAAALTLAPAVGAALLFERQIEGRLGSLRPVAVAQIAAGVALAAADRTPGSRGRGDAVAADHLLIGLAQAAALVPGVSRGGASLTAARLRGLERGAAARLAREAGLPVTLGAAVLKSVRAARGAVPPDLAAPFAAGTGAAFASALASRGLARALERIPSYLPLSAYRVGLGALALFLGRRS
jgi:undecaprenyl-diphosphatase